MPLPTPGKNEKESDFMKRCMPISNKEAKDPKQAVAVCMSQFRRKKSKGLLSEADEAYRSTKYTEQAIADKKAGYPPNCNKGYVEKGGKCVKVNENEEFAPPPAEAKKTKGK